jgi:hypothetical protein
MEEIKIVLKGKDEDGKELKKMYMHSVHQVLFCQNTDLPEAEWECSCS